MFSIEIPQGQGLARNKNENLVLSQYRRQMYLYFIGKGEIRGLHLVVTGVVRLLLGECMW